MDLRGQADAAQAGALIFFERLCLIKLAARVIENATRIRMAFTSACPYKLIVAHLARGYCVARSVTAEAACPRAHPTRHP